MAPAQMESLLLDHCKVASCLGTISGPQTFWIVATPALPEARVLGIKVVGHNTQTNDHPLATAIGPLRNGPVLPHLEKEFREWSGGRDRKTDFSRLGAGSQHALQERDTRYRECWRGT